MKFTCERCGFETEYKCSLIKHLERKKSCNSSLSNISREDLIKKLKEKKRNDVTYDCRFCSAQFNHYANCQRHQQTCKEKNDEIMQLRLEIKELKNSINITNNITNNVQVTINNYGNENKDYLSKDFLMSCIKRKNNGMLELIKTIHFNKDHAENHNVRIANKKLPYIEKYVDRWQYCTKEEVLDELIHEGFQIMDEYHCDNEDDLKKKLTQRFYDDLGKWLGDVDQKEKEVIEPLRRDLYLVVLNNSYMVLTK